MADYELKQDTSQVDVIDDNATLSNGARAAGDYDNSTALDPFGIFTLTVQYDGGPPSAGTKIADLYLLPGVGSTPTYPDGGDAGLGTDDTPQSIYWVASFQSINPSTSVDEVLGTVEIPLYTRNRIVIVNTSGQTFDATWILRLQPTKRSVA